MSMTPLLAHARRAIGRRCLSTSPASPLEGQVAWIVGGIGIVGTGIARGLLDAGANVIVNSRYAGRLTKISEELGHPERLVTLNSSLLPGSAEATVAMAMDITGNRLDHVVAHSAVRWWADGASDETSTLSPSGSLLHMDPMEYNQVASQLGSLHYAAAHHLTPLMSHRGGSFTFITSSADAVWGSSSAAGLINAYGVMGLAAAMRSEATNANWNIRVGELRLGSGLRLNRPKSERESDPRERPLSDDIGRVVSGIVANGQGGLLPAADLFEFELLKKQYNMN